MMFLGTHADQPRFYNFTLAPVALRAGQMRLLGHYEKLLSSELQLGW